MTINWHKNHSASLTFGGRLADSVANFMGSWKFIILQTIVVAAWMVANVIGYIYHWDEYPFILLNLLFSTEAAYAAPIIMQSQNRQAEMDRHHADADFEINKLAKEEIESLQMNLSRIEQEKLDIIIDLLRDLQKRKPR